MQKKLEYKNVIEIFRSLETDMPRDFLAYLVGPNMVLTLSGERALGDGVYWFKKEADAESTLKELEVLKKVVLKHLDGVNFFCSRFENQNVPDQIGLEYTILYKSGLANALSSTELLPAESISHLLESADKMSEQSLHQLVVGELEKDARWDRMSIGDRSAMADGVQLGYPDKAILSCIANNFNYHDRERNFFVDGSANHHYEELVDAEIKFSRYIDCPEPRYSYARSMINDEDIKEHERRWSKVLEDFYTSDYFIELGKDPGFRRKIDKLLGS
jgi:hypothetical protein